MIKKWKKSFFLYILTENFTVYVINNVRILGVCGFCGYRFEGATTQKNFIAEFLTQKILTKINDKMAMTKQKIFQQWKCTFDTTELEYTTQRFVKTALSKLMDILAPPVFNNSTFFFFFNTYYILLNRNIWAFIYSTYWYLNFLCNFK